MYEGLICLPVTPAYCIHPLFIKVFIGHYALLVSRLFFTLRVNQRVPGLVVVRFSAPAVSTSTLASREVRAAPTSWSQLRATDQAIIVAVEPQKAVFLHFQFRDQAIAVDVHFQKSGR